MQTYERTRTKAEAQHLAQSIRGNYAQVNVVPDRESLNYRWVVMVEPIDRTEYCVDCRKYHNPPVWPTTCY